MILFIIASIFSENITRHWAVYRNHYWLWCTGLLFWLPFLTGLWSDNLSAWQRLIEIKIPLLLIPFCSFVFTKFSPGITIRVNIFFVVVIVIGCAWSLRQYAMNFSAIQEDYLKARVMATPMSNEHVRFSWAVVIACLVLAYETVKNFAAWKKTYRIIALATIAFFVFYLHVLSARTGIIGFYLIAIIQAIYFLRRKLLLFLLSLGIIFLLPILCWFLLPTFQNRLRFIWWDFQNYMRGNYVEGLSDVPRILSLKAGWQIMNEHPLGGTGFGDLNHEMFLWYNRNATYLREYERLMPSNEALVYSAGAGIFTGFIFLAVVLMPFFLKSLRKNIYWICFHLIARVIFMY